MHSSLFLAVFPFVVQALPMNYGIGLALRDDTPADSDLLLSCPGAAGSPNVERADKCTLVIITPPAFNTLPLTQLFQVNIQNNADQIIFSNVGSPQLNCAGGTTPTSVTLGGSTTVATTTTTDATVGISLDGITIGGGVSSSSTQTSQTTKSITYTVTPGRQAVLTAGFNFHSQTGNVQVNYGDRVDDHFIWFTGAQVTQLTPDDTTPPEFEVHESACGTDPLDLNNHS